MCAYMYGGDADCPVAETRSVAPSIWRMPACMSIPSENSATATCITCTWLGVYAYVRESILLRCTDFDARVFRSLRGLNGEGGGHSVHKERTPSKTPADDSFNFNVHRNMMILAISTYTDTSVKMRKKGAHSQASSVLVHKNGQLCGSAVFRFTRHLFTEYCFGICNDLP